MFFTQIEGLTYWRAPHYANFPIRTLAPALTLCLLAFIHTAQSQRAKTVLLVLAALVATGGIFWCPDSGLVATAALLGYVCYRLLCEHKITSAMFWRKTAFSLAALVLSFLLWFLLLQGVTAARTGQAYPISALLWSITAFAGDGFNMIPLPARHPYIYVLGSYSAGLVLPLYSLFRDKEKPNREAQSNALIFAVAVMGFGTFLYYLGRSHVYVFLQPVWPAFIALAFFALRLYGYSRQRLAAWRESGYGWHGWGDVPGLVSGAVAGAAALALAFFVFATGLSLGTVTGSEPIQEFMAARKTATLPFPADLPIIAKYRRDALLVVDSYAMFSLSELDVQNQYRGQALVDFFFKEDLENIVSQLEEYEGRVLLGPDFAALFANEITDSASFAAKLDRVLEARYVLTAAEGGWQVFDSK
jgi:hypothetical protein